VRFAARRTDDADVIRARLRALLAEGTRPGWVPEDRGQATDDDGDDDEDEDDGDLDPLSGAEPDRRPDVDPVAGAGRHRAVAPAVRVDPGRPGARALWVAAIAAVTLLLLWTWLQRPAAEPVSVGLTRSTEGVAGPAHSTSVPVSPPVGEVLDASTTVVVSVVGLVAEPGLVTLASGSRVADAVEAAGGLLPEADPASINLAAVVADGQQVAVGVPQATGAQAPATASPTGVGGALNLNTADVPALDGLPGIGPVLAQRIVEHREQHGPFGQVEDLLDVTGIGPAILDQLTGAVTV
jgi:competence protein ComEA